MALAFERFRDQLHRIVPWWLSDRVRVGPGKNVGFRFLWVLAALLDVFMDVALAGMIAAWPGHPNATPTALAWIGRNRGIIRGQADTDAEYAARLRNWLVYWRDAGTQRAVARAIHEYLGNAPRVRVVNRAGTMTEVAADGSITVTFGVAWDWDSVSNPERAGYWWEQWIIVYPTQWAHRGVYGAALDTWGGDALGFGHERTRVELDAVKGLINQWKRLSTRVRAVIWTSDANIGGSTLPNGTWGKWSMPSSGSAVASGRVRSDTRYWEPAYV